MCFEKRDADLAAALQERDDLRKQVAELRKICEKQAEYCGRCTAMALELDTLKDEKFRLEKKWAAAEKLIERIIAARLTCTSIYVVDDLLKDWREREGI